MSVTELIKAFSHKVLKTDDGQYYVRSGSCNQCGSCCKDIYLVHGDETIKTPEQFEALKPKNPEYQHFKPMAQDEEGLRFVCLNLTPDNTCAIYNQRPLFCRLYPTESSLLMGGKLAKGCGYHFTLKQTFGQVLQKLSSP